MVHNLLVFNFLCFHFSCFGKREGEENHRETPPSLHYYFLISGKREGEEKHRETPPSLHYYFLSFFQVGCTVMFYSIQGSVQPQEIGELYKNLTVLSSLDAST